MAESSRTRSSVAESSVGVDVSGLDRIGLALADPIRRSVLVELLAGPACPSDLADRLGTSRPNLSNHLACLRGCGLIRAERSGRYRYYQLTSDELASVLRALATIGPTLPDCQSHLP